MIKDSVALSKSPLGIIALFIVLVYGFASLVVGASESIIAEERVIIVYFMVSFPVLVLAMFGWLVSKHHQKLYTPNDYKNPDSFFDVFVHGEKNKSKISKIDETITSQIEEVLGSQELREKLKNFDEVEDNLKGLAQQLTNQIREKTFVKIDISSFSNEDNPVLELPVDAFLTVREFLDEVFMHLEYVDAFEYGYTWVLQNSATARVVESQGMIDNIPKWKGFEDNRPLESVGLHAGQTFKVTRPIQA
jgi:hypothetical protein